MSCIITSTPHIRERFLKINNNTIEVCNYPILEEFSVQSDWLKKNSEICYVGAITEIRGINEIIEAISKCNVRLNLAGNYTPVNLREELIKKEGWKKVNEYGFVGREEIANILSSSKIGLVTLYPQSNYLDSLPIKLFEYMIAGIPVIASDFPLWRKIIEEENCGICVNPKDPDKISEAINMLTSDDTLAYNMGQNGRKAALEKYNWKIEEKKLLYIYKSFE
jgi:glycosyltransferase involved in cell wall biosynthesis